MLHRRCIGTFCQGVVLGFYSEFAVMPSLEALLETAYLDTVDWCRWKADVVRFVRFVAAYRTRKLVVLAYDKWYKDVGRA